ncbi:TonB-dependent siderophore receptor [Psychromonas sp. SP041]|uniref:TonB-dependent receptor family protein n=1 Tax=Psychromonas sp. SP041 TaxID=1365007 RepID=UPI0003F835A3|nr:TonB-dependent siderophore receptor [Psychromonas sp. SP041]
MKGKTVHFKMTTLSVAIATGLISSYVQADEADKIEPIVVTASVLGNSEVEDIKLFTGSRSILTSKELEKTGARSIDTALQQIPGVKILDETGTGVLPNVSIRGVTSSRSGHAQFLLDGIPLSLAPYSHNGQSLFPATLEMIDRIDVVRGGSAVQYGPNNVSGVINLISKPIPEVWTTSLNEKVTFFGNKKVLYDTSFSTGGSVNEYFDIRFSGNILSGESFRDHSDTDVQNWMLQTNWKISDDKSLATTLQYYEADTELPGALNPAAYKEDRIQSLRTNDAFDANTIRLSTTYNQILGDIGIADYAEFDLITFANKSDREFSFENDANTLTPPTLFHTAPREFEIFGIEPRATAFIDGEITQDWIVGTRYVHEDIDQSLNRFFYDGVTEPRLIRNRKVTTNAMAYYVSNKIGFFDDRFVVTPGIRYEDVRLSYDEVVSGAQQKQHIKEVLPSLTLGYTLSEQWFTFANVQKSLRTPQVSHLTSTTQTDSIDPEISWNYEVGTRFTPTHNSSINLTLYRIDNKDKIESNSTGTQFENIGKTRSQGVEIEGQFSPENLPELTLRASYNYLDTEQLEGDNKGNELQDASKHQFSASASYNYNDIDLGLSAYYYSKAFSDSANTVEEDETGEVGELPAYTVVNLTAATELYKKGTQSLTASVALNNAFDNDYYFRGLDVSAIGRIPAPGRSVSLNLGYKF